MMSTRVKVANSTVDQFMTTTVISLGTNQTLLEALKALVDNGISAAPIVDANKHLLSVCSEADLLKLCISEGTDVPIHKVISKFPKLKDLITVKRKDHFTDVLKQFLTNPVRRVFVIDDVNRVVGVISRRDILKIYIQSVEPEEFKI